MSRTAPRGALIRSVVACLWLVAGCTTSSVPPAPTPADFGGITHLFRTSGLTIGDVVSGDAGCPDTNLARTAIRFRASGLDQATPVPVYLYIFNDQAAFQRRASDVARCAESYVTDPANLESIDVSPYVLAGQGPWASAFRQALRAGLTAAAGNGGTGPGPGGGPP